MTLQVEVTGDRPLEWSLAQLCSAMVSHAAAAEVPGRVHVHVTALGGGRHLVRAPAVTPQVVPSEEALSRVMAAINQSVLRATPLLAFHCAVVTRGGVTAALAGRSGQGKSTLTVAMLQRGWQYVSDEALALPWRGGPPTAYPRPVSLSPWSSAALDLAPGVPGSGEAFYSPAALDARVAQSPSPVTHLVALDRMGAQPAPVVEVVRRPVLVDALLRRGFTVHTKPASALRQVQTVVLSAQALRLRLGDPRESAAALDEALCS